MVGECFLSRQCNVIITGYQLLEELQSELREKSHLASQLRSQLEFTDRQHEEVLGALVAERDSLRVHLNMLREENLSLTHLRRDYDDACERLCSNEAELQTTRRDLEAFKKKIKSFADETTRLEAEKMTLQDLLSKSKEECHRVNEMYANRQSALLEENESMRSSHADLSARLQDQDEFLQQIIKEKVLLEMELKDMLNKSNQTHLRLDRSIDVSYTEDQMLTALDSLNVDSRFSQDNHLLDEESFLNALKEDQGRATNMSLFDEIRLSFSANISRHNMTDNTPKQDRFQYLDRPFNFVETQGDDSNETEPFTSENRESINKSVITTGTQTGAEYNDIENYSIATQTDDQDKNKSIPIKIVFTKATQSNIENVCRSHIETQTDDFHNNNNVIKTCLDCSKCNECENLKKYIEKLENDVKISQRIVKEAESDLAIYENNLVILQKLVQDGTDRNSLLQNAVDSLQSKIVLLEASCANQRDLIDSLNCEVRFVQCQTESGNLLCNVIYI
ncbi:unnamed protein product [Chilo suppressalis]|uniref:HAP1 N-terminal domain-containing protein n=1 Tax=Chilo suppressalis TaxID=168631 RepID=A0ABN8AXS7_CHISP|nr:unnamed protein product [Chilo suppressalis]